MKITKGKILNFIVFFAIFLMMAQLILIQDIGSAHADDDLWKMQVGMEEEIGKEAFGQTGNPEDVRVIVAKVVKVILSMVGITFFVLIVLAGYKWMTSGGNEEKVKEAKSQILKAVIGLIIIFISWFITTFVAGCLADITSDSVFADYCP
jgi:amino acid transporter